MIIEQQLERKYSTAKLLASIVSVGATLAKARRRADRQAAVAAFERMGYCQELPFAGTRHARQPRFHRIWKACRSMPMWLARTLLRISPKVADVAERVDAIAPICEKAGQMGVVLIGFGWAALRWWS